MSGWELHGGWAEQVGRGGQAKRATSSEQSPKVHGTALSRYLADNGAISPPRKASADATANPTDPTHTHDPSSSSSSSSSALSPPSSRLQREARYIDELLVSMDQDAHGVEQVAIALTEHALMIAKEEREGTGKWKAAGGGAAAAGGTGGAGAGNASRHTGTRKVSIEDLEKLSQTSQ